MEDGVGVALELLREVVEVTQPSSFGQVFGFLRVVLWTQVAESEDGVGLALELLREVVASLQLLQIVADLLGLVPVF